MKTQAKLATLLAFIVALSIPLGCNTFRGMGQDIQKGGQAVEETADNIKEDMRSEYSITSTADIGGSINPIGTTRVEHSASINFTVVPNLGYHVADVVVDGTSVGAVSRHTFETVDRDHTIQAIFTIDPR